MDKDVSKVTGCLLALVAFAALITIADPGEYTGDTAVVLQSSDATTPEGIALENLLLQEDAQPKAKAGAGKWGATQASAPNREKLPESILSKQDVPRRDFDGNHVSNEFCGGPKYYDQKKCSKEYEESMIMTAAPLMVLALVSVLIWIAVLIGRNCCKCFAGSHKSGMCGSSLPTEGYCCGPLREKGYSEFERKVFLFLTIAIVVFVAVGMIVGFSGNSELSSGVHNLLDVTSAIPVKLRTRIHHIEKEFSTLQALGAQVNPYLQPSMWDALQQGLHNVDAGAAKMQKQVDSSMTTMKSYENERSSWMYCGLWIPFCISLFALLGYPCPKLLPVLVFPTVVLTTVVIWVVVGVHVPVAVATSDFCVGMDYGLKHGVNASSPMDMLVGCHGTAGAAKMAESTKYFTGTADQVACQTLEKQLCALPKVQYPDEHGVTQSFDHISCPPQPCSNKTLGTLVNKTVVRDFMYSCAKLENGNIIAKECKYVDEAAAKDQCRVLYGNELLIPCVPGSSKHYREVNLATCKENCFLNSTKLPSNTVVGNHKLSTRFKLVNDQQLKPLTDCSFIRDQAALIEKSLCWSVVDATDYIVAGLSIIGVTFFFGSFIYLGAQKRFHRKYLAENNAWDEERAYLLQNELGIEESAEASTEALLGQEIKNEE